MNDKTGVVGAGVAPHEKEAKSPEVVRLLEKVSADLVEGHIQAAIHHINRARLDSVWATNALGVCQLRLGNTKGALELFRRLVLGYGGLAIREDVPAVFKSNYAAALLADNNIAGATEALRLIRGQHSPAVQKLELALANWKSGLTLWQKIDWYMGGIPNRPITLEPPLGELE